MYSIYCDEHTVQQDISVTDQCRSGAENDVFSCNLKRFISANVLLRKQSHVVLFIHLYCSSVSYCHERTKLLLLFML